MCLPWSILKKDFLHGEAYIVDVGDEASVKEARYETEKILGREGLNVLINNAGIHPRCSSIQNVDAEKMAETYRCNVIGPAVMCRVSCCFYAQEIGPSFCVHDSFTTTERAQF